jgi:hypothetical protein
VHGSFLLNFLIFLLFFFPDPPSSPSQPGVVDSGYDFIKINWKKPDNDGGNPITGYMVEMKSKSSSDWIPCNSFPTKATEYTASGLVESQSYEFRVKAVNEAGPGSPSKASNWQKAEPPTCTLFVVFKCSDFGFV